MPTATYAPRSHAEHWITRGTRSKQHHPSRRAKVRPIIVVHTAENIPDTVATDGGAEAVAGYILRRDDPGSYHSLVDSDSVVPVIPYEWTAFHDGTGSNAWSLGLSFATTAAWWPLAPAKWRDGAIIQGAREAARMAMFLRAETGKVPEARLITKAESDRGVPGFISHGLRDPGRRSDPGARFPWQFFFDHYLLELARYGVSTPNHPTPPEEDDMALSDTDIDRIVLAVIAGTDNRFDRIDTKLKEIRGWLSSLARFAAPVASLLARAPWATKDDKAELAKRDTHDELRATATKDTA